jgi:hypothetical protein
MRDQPLQKLQNQFLQGLCDNKTLISIFLANGTGYMGRSNFSAIKSSRSEVTYRSLSTSTPYLLSFQWQRNSRIQYDEKGMMKVQG